MLRVLQHPLRRLHFLHHAIAVLFAQDCTPSVIGLPPASCEVGAGLQPVPRKAAFAAEGEGDFTIDSVEEDQEEEKDQGEGTQVWI